MIESRVKVNQRSDGVTEIQIRAILGDGTCTDVVVDLVVGALVGGERIRVGYFLEFSLRDSLEIDEMNVHWVWNIWSDHIVYHVPIFGCTDTGLISGSTIAEPIVSVNNEIESCIS